MAGLGDFVRAGGQMASRNIAAGPEFVLSRLMEPSVFRTLSPMQQLAAIRGDYKAFLRAGGKGSGLAPAIGRAAVERDFTLVPDELVRRPVFDMIPRPPRELSVPPAVRMPPLVDDAPMTHAVDPITGEIITDFPIKFIPSNERGALSLLDPGFRGYQTRVGRKMADQYGPGMMRGALDNPGNALSVLPEPAFFTAEQQAAAARADTLGLAALLAAAGAGIAGMDAAAPENDSREMNIREMQSPSMEMASDIPVTVQDGMPAYSLPGGFGGYEDNLPLADDPSATAMLAAETSQLPTITAEASPAELEAEAQLALLLPYIGEENARLVRYHIQNGGSYRDALSAMIQSVR